MHSLLPHRQTKVNHLGYPPACQLAGNFYFSGLELIIVNAKWISCSSQLIRTTVSRHCQAMDGLQAVRIIRKSLSTKAEPLIVLSSIQIYKHVCALGDIKFHLTRRSTAVQQGLESDSRLICEITLSAKIFKSDRYGRIFHPYSSFRRKKKFANQNRKSD